MTYDIINKDFTFGNHNVMKVFQKPAALQSITILNVAEISKIFTNTRKIIDLEI